MEERVGSSREEPEKDTPYPLGDFLDKLCVYYMTMGLSYDEFWHGDYAKLEYAEKAYTEKLKHDNQMAWLSGLYIYNAVGTVIANAFRKKGAKPVQYVKEPFALFETEEDEETKKRKAQEAVVSKLNMIKARFDGNHKSSNQNKNERG